jgi:hypothetical protein
LPLFGKGSEETIRYTGSIFGDMGPCGQTGDHHVTGALSLSRYAVVEDTRFAKPTVAHFREESIPFGGGHNSLDTPAVHIAIGNPIA